MAWRSPALALLCLLSSAPCLRGERVTSADAAPAAHRRAYRRPLSVASVLVAAAGAHEAPRSRFEDTEGKVSAAEFRETFSASSGDAGSEALAAFDRLFAYADVDGDGFLKTGRRPSSRSFLLSVSGAGEETVAKVAAAAERSRAAGKKTKIEKEARAWPELPNEFGQDLAEAVMAVNDEDGDGVVSREEFDVGMRRLAARWGWGAFLEDPDVLEWYDELFAQGDIDGDGVLAPREAQYTSTKCEVAYRSNKFADKHLHDIMMRKIDLNGDGKIDKSEIVALTIDIQAARGIDGAAIATVAEKILSDFAEADTDGDGALSREEAALVASRMVAEL